MSHEMLYSGSWGYVIFTCSLAICISYQVIPSALKVIEDVEKDEADAHWLVDITSSTVFRFFIRWCGINHIVMSGVMLGVAHGVITSTNFWRSVVLAGEAAVAFISILSAIAIWRVRWHVQKK